MKNMLKLLGICVVAAVATVSCDKVEHPNVIITDLDTLLFPGNFFAYDFPTFDENTNTERNVVIADYTGHQCPFCPPAAEKAEDLATANPDRVFVIGIHASPEGDGSGDFQALDPENGFVRDFTTPEGKEMAVIFKDLPVGFNSNPKGTINRIKDDEGKFFSSHGFWGEKTDETLLTSLDVNIQAKSNFYTETNGGFIHTETEFLNEKEGNFNIVIYAIENSFVAPQKIVGETIEDYVHKDIHIGNVFNETWGRPLVSGTISAGRKINNDFSYKMPDGLTPETMHFLIVVYNRDTYEVEQVIKHHF